MTYKYSITCLRQIADRRNRFCTTLSCVSSVLIVACNCSFLDAAPPSFQGVGDLAGGGYYSHASAVSRDGSVVVGESLSSNGTEGFRWTNGSLSGLGTNPDGSFPTYSTAASGDGTVVVGQSVTPTGYQAFRWTADGGMVGLGYRVGSVGWSYASGVSADGSVVVGMSPNSNYQEAFRWTAATGMIGLGDLPGGTQYSSAAAVSADGGVVVGWSQSANSSSGLSEYGEAFRWTQADGMVGLGDLPGGGFRSAARAVSADGSVVVGAGETSDCLLAFRWTSSLGMQPLGDLPGGSCSSQAYGASADGSVIVGRSSGENGLRAFIWDPQNGMQDLTSVLISDYGLNLNGWDYLMEATGVSNDGRTIVGMGYRGFGLEGWVAHVPEPASITMAALGALIVLRRRPAERACNLRGTAKADGPNSLAATRA